MAKNLLSIIAVVLFGILAGFSLLHEGLIPTHDAEYHIVRFFLFNEAFNDGNLYPRWAAHLNNGFGVPLFTFVYPLPNYIAVFLYSLGLSFIDSFRFEMLAAILLGAIFFYLWAREFWGRLGGIVSSVFYTFSPYHFVDIYIRGSVGEVWALAFFPAFLWAITRYIQDKQKIFLILSSLFLSLIIFSHNILALMFFFFALFYIVFLIYQEKNKKHIILNIFYIILLSLGLSSIFWLPAFLEKDLVRGLEIFDVSAHFPNLYQLLIPSWGSGFSADTLVNQMSFQIGIANLTVVLLSLLSVIFIFIFRHSGKRSASRISNGSERFWTSQNDGRTAIIIFFLVWFFVVFFLMLKISLPIWQIIPLMTYFQFPWRFLSLEILIVSFLSGSVIFAIKNYFISKIKASGVISSACLIFLALMLGIGYSRPAHYLYRDDNYYITRSNFIDGTNSPGNVFNTIWFNQSLKKQKDKLTFLKGKGRIEEKMIKTTHYLFNINTYEDSELLANTAYFPGWEVYVNNQEENINPTKNGRFTFYLPSGENNVEIKFNDTIIRKFSALISFASLLLIVVLSMEKRFVKI